MVYQQKIVFFCHLFLMETAELTFSLKLSELLPFAISKLKFSTGELRFENWHSKLSGVDFDSNGLWSARQVVDNRIDAEDAIKFLKFKSIISNASCGPQNCDSKRALLLSPNRFWCLATRQVRQDSHPIALLTGEVSGMPILKFKIWTAIRSAPAGDELKIVFRISDSLIEKVFCWKSLFIKRIRPVDCIN